MWRHWTQDATKDAGVRSRDRVTVRPAPDVVFGKAVFVLTYWDTIAEVLWRCCGGGGWGVVSEWNYGVATVAQ